MRCLTITLNPAVDTTYWLGSFEIGGANRVLRVRRAAAGKGVNVARVMRTLGHDVIATGFLGGEQGEFIAASLEAEGVVNRFVTMEDGISRTCCTLIDETTGVSTEVLERGPSLGPVDLDRLSHKLDDLLPGVEAVVLAGSVPDGVTAEFLDHLMSRVRAHAHRLFVDASGPALEALVEHGPDLIKPNEHEMDLLIGRASTVEERIAFAREELIGRKLPADGQVLLTLGKEGAALIARDQVLRASSPAIRAVNTVGCGDALLAGFVDSWLSGQGDVSALRNAVACGSAAALREVAGEVDVADRDRLLPGVGISLWDRSGAGVAIPGSR
jgi:tagatose 6-phosphate kinase